MDRLLATFLDLVRIDSPTGHEGAVAAYVARALEEAGCEVRIDDTGEQTGSESGNVIARLPGAVPGRVVALAAHMDCVQPCEGVEPVVAGGVVRSGGDTVLGADDKAGLAAIIEAVRRLGESGVPHAEVRVLATVSEETGLKGAKALRAEDCQADVCLVLDADGPVGGIVTAAPTHYTFSAEFTGRAAHAGVQPEKGVSAIEMAAAAICRMTLGRLDEQTTANVGTIAGGSATNIVAPSCTVTGECRSLDPERVEQVREQMEAAMADAAASAGGTVEVAWRLEYRGFRVSDDSDVLALVEEACRRVGVEPRRFSTGGGSDGNVIAAHGVPTLVLSCGMTDVHSSDESIEVAELGRLADVIEAVVRGAAG